MSWSCVCAHHALQCCRCIKSKQYFLARRLLDQDIYCLADTGLVAGDYLLYCYYGGLVCIAIKDHDLAFHLLQLSITMPTTCADAIMQAAWSRYQLLHTLRTGAAQPQADTADFVRPVLRAVTPLAHVAVHRSATRGMLRSRGKLCRPNQVHMHRAVALSPMHQCPGEDAPFPKHASQAARRDQKDASPVTQLTAHFAAGRAEKFVEVLSQHEAALRDEGVLGLVWQLRDRFPVHTIRRLTATFLTLSLDDLATQAGLPSAEAAKQLVAKCDAACPS